MKDDFNYRKLLDSVDFLKKSVININKHVGLKNSKQLITKKSVISSGSSNDESSNENKIKMI